jgi:type II secretory pathway pseudopilin PulG
MNARFSSRPAAFTLIELVGVLAIMAIMAAVIAPSALRSMNRTAEQAEAQNLSGLGAQVALYLRDQGTAPTPANWTTALAQYAGMSSVNLGANSLGISRVYVTDPAANPTPRAMILSSMRRNLALPTAANIATAAAFSSIWQTPDGSVPPVSGWAGWAGWAATAGGGEYLVIQRINLGYVYATDLRNFTITLNNRSGAVASYKLVSGSGAAAPAVNVAAGANVMLPNQTPKTQISLYTAAGGVGLNYSYVISASGKTFDFDGVNWIPQ